ncbi:DNA-dependent metalloprotease WSS1 [Aristolochia californica]|uniref:DNA-dependent metalloprotease WSS1 n=1 Tax=Aristolochia californica TaxID=171875 RepID=UPI0035DDF1D1
MDLGDLNKVWEVKPLKKIGEDDARKILERIAKQVQPIMWKHKWRVKLLSEFCPANPSLLGLNVGGGVQIKLRLRRPNRDWDFIPYEQVLDTMLHELCHNEVGPHNASFYKLWDEIRKECEELISKGVTGTGQGFDAPGRRLGGYSFHPPPPSLRQATLSAAEKRQRLGALLPSGPKRLGGDSNIMVALSPIQAAAMAAERRLQDDLWCASGSFEESILEENNSSMLTGAGSKRSSEGMNNTIDLRSDGRNRSASSSSSDSALKHSVTESSEDKAIWECGVCTLFNQPLALTCEACGSQKPREKATKYKVWTCKFCTLENSIELDKCTACEQWRYSYGQPVATRGPYIGT